MGFVYGGDGNPRYVDVQLVFFSMTGDRLPTRLLERGQVMKRPGVRSLFQYFEVPPGADVVVVTTNPAKNGSVEWTRFHAPPAEPLTGSSTEFMQFMGVLPYKFLLANYGPADIRALPNL